MVFQGFFFNANKVAVEDISKDCEEKDNINKKYKGELGKGVKL